MLALLASLALGVSVTCDGDHMPCELTITFTGIVQATATMSLDTETPDPRHPEIQLVSVHVTRTGGVFPEVREQYLVMSQSKLEAVMFALRDDEVEVDVPLGALALRVTPDEDVPRLALAVVRAGWLRKES